MNKLSLVITAFATIYFISACTLSYGSDINNQEQLYNNLLQLQLNTMLQNKTSEEKNDLKNNMVKFDESIGEEKCEIARYLADEIIDKINSLINKYEPSEKAYINLKEVIVRVNLKYRFTCSKDIDEIENYIIEEAKNGSALATEFIKYLETNLEKTLPSFSDYSTDLNSTLTYRKSFLITPKRLCEVGYKNKSSDGAYCLALKASIKGNVDDTIRYLSDAANLGSSMAKNDLAHLYDKLRKPEHLPKIKELILAAAQNGIPEAQVSVGWWYMTGENGFVINYKEAMDWNLKGYKQGHPEGANNIGELYEKGWGVSKDLSLAKAWYKKASVLGNDEATKKLSQFDK